MNRSSTADEVLADIGLSGKNFVVTGANAGIGFETARSLAAHGASVYLGCRREQTGQAAVDRIRRAHSGAGAHYLPLDLASFASVRLAAERLPDRISAVICNAGVYGPYAETADGFERTVGVCHLGHFLLVHSLLGRLKAGAPARVVMVSSESHRHPAVLDFSRFPLTRERYRPMIAYGQAKLCNVLMANELTRRFSADGVVGNSLHPGTLVRTSIGRNSVLAAAVLWLASPFTKNVAQAAATSAYCAAHPDVEGVGGRYFVDCRERPASPGALDARTAARLWDLSVEWVGADQVRG